MSRLLEKTRVFLEMIKFEHSIFALPFAYAGLFLGESGWPRWNIFLLVTLAMVSCRTMGMSLNRLIDLKIDAQNPRTQSRALPAGKLKKTFVWAATLLSFSVFEWAAYALSPLCFKLSLIPVFLSVLYPFLKRFTWLSHMVLGIILAIAPYGAWLASTNHFSWVPGFISLGVMAWVTGFDVIYALQDVEFDRKQGLYSIPARFSPEAGLKVTRLLHGATISFWILAGMAADLGLIYRAGTLAAALFLIREHWLIRSFGLKKVGEAFFTMNAVISVVFLISVILDVSFGS